MYKREAERIKKKIRIAAAVLCLILLVLGVEIAKGSLDYRIMNMEQQLKAQIKREQQVYSDAIFDSVEVIRPWYSTNPCKWKYRVKLTDSNEILLYERDSNGNYVLVEQ